MLTADGKIRWRAARAFAVTGTAAIITGGLLAAAIAHHPLQHWVWASAYLVLVVGVAQIAFGTGQAWLSTRVPAARWVTGEWIVFNSGNAGVIAGTLSGSFVLLLAGTALFAAGVALFLFGALGKARNRWVVGYRISLIFIFLSSLVGLTLAAMGHLH